MNITVALKKNNNKGKINKFKRRGQIRGEFKKNLRYQWVKYLTDRDRADQRKFIR